MMRWLSVCVAAIGLFVSGCATGGGAVVFAPTPLPPDLSPQTYTHPAGAFMIRVPPDWAVRSQNLTTLAGAAFSPPGVEAPVLSVAVINLGSATEPPIADIINTYQRELRADVRRYSEQDRQAMGDGSWRLLGVRTTAGGDAQQLNTFIGRSGGYLGVVEAVLPTDPALIAQLERIVNTFQINPAAALQPTDLNVLRGAHRADLEVTNVTAWATVSGVFFVTGEIANFGSTPLSSIPVEVTLYDQAGVMLFGARDTVMGYAVPPGGFAPFSLRFGQGRPAEAVSFRVTLGGPDGQGAAASPLLGAESLTWTDTSRFSNEGHLLIDGTLTNIGSQPAHAPLATVTVFNAVGDVIGAAFTRILEGDLAPTDSITYRLRLPELGGQPTNYIVNIQATLREQTANLTPAGETTPDATEATGE